MGNTHGTLFSVVAGLLLILMAILASGAALRDQKPPPPLGPIDAPFRDYIERFGAVRREGLTRAMKSEDAERLFALGFALEQLREHLAEVHRVVGEWAHD